ncbi:MAG: hypothetical protein Q9187_007123 [Circinaria calcarea]
MSGGKFPGNYTLRELTENGFITSLNTRNPRANLSANPHQLFTKWVRFPHSDYQAMRMVIHLASALFMSPASISFIHAIMYGQRKRTNFSGDSKVYLEELYKAVPLNETVREEVELGLADLMDAIHWEAYDPTGPEYAEGEHSGALTVKLDDKKVSFRGGLPVTLFGFASKILVNAEIIETLRKLVEIQDPSPADLNRILRLQFNLAVSMVHGMCHAINNATHKTAEPFYRGQSINELGRAWENHVFGGHVEPYNGVLDGNAPLCVCKWPPQIGMANPSSGLYMRRRPKGSSTYYYVSMDFIANTQLQRKWDQVRSDGLEDNTNLLHIPKQVGYREYNQGQVDAQWDKSQSSEGNYEADADDRVLRY